MRRPRSRDAQSGGVRLAPRPLIQLDLHPLLGVWCLCAPRKAVLHHTGNSTEGHRWKQVTIEGILVALPLTSWASAFLGGVP